MKKLWCFLFGHRVRTDKLYLPLWWVRRCGRCDAVILCERGAE